ncbi:MAG: hypothetical protein ACXW1R_08650, partial [Halobacteriota archaeon]
GSRLGHNSSVSRGAEIVERVTTALVTLSVRPRTLSSFPVFDEGEPRMRDSLMLALIALGAALTPVLAAPSSLAGSWHGSGTISSRNNTDAVRCHVRFTKVGGASFNVSSQCTTDTGRYDISGRVDASGANRYSGWSRLMENVATSLSSKAANCSP